MYIESKLKKIISNYRVFVFLLLFLADVSFALSAERGGDTQFWDNYRVLVEQNIFSRQRGRALRRDDDKPKERPAPALESYFVLKGIVRQNEEYVAFLEDTRIGETVRARAGDSIARGRVKNLTLDNIEFEMDANSITVEIGDSLQGKAPTRSVTYNDLVEWSQSSSGSSGNEASGQETGQSSDDEEILRRLMERRRRETGG
jgi:hypothetical protein